MLEQFWYLFLVFSHKFLGIFLNLIFWVLIIWVIISWLMIFRVMRPDNPGYHLFAQIVRPILLPFRWARIGMLDLSVIAAFLTIDFVGNYLLKFIAQLIQG